MPRTQLTADERKVLSRQVRLLRKRYGADSVAVVKVFSHTDEVACAEGLYDPHNGHISVHRDVLCNEQHLAATLVHEVAHRIAHRRGVSWEDRTRGFENVLSELAGIALVPRRHV